MPRRGIGRRIAASRCARRARPSLVRMRRLVLVAASTAAAILAFGEVSHWRASRRRLGSAARVGAREAIIVLGYRNAGTRANFLNRSRVRAALRSIDPAATTSVVVFCGGAARGPVPEAELMEAYARVDCGYTGSSELDRSSLSTRENIHNAIPLVEQFDTIKIVSNPLHAEKGRAHLWELRPDLAARLVRGADYRFGELMWLKPIAAVLGMWSLRGMARGSAAPGS